jgi:hypothetical protein
MTHMLLESIREDEDIIEIDDVEDIEEFTKTIISVGLERCRSISKTKGHNEVFKVIVTSSKSSLVLIPFHNS